MQLAMKVAHNDNRRSRRAMSGVGMGLEGVDRDTVGFFVKHFGGEEDERVKDRDGQNGGEFRGRDALGRPVEAGHEIEDPIQAGLPVLGPRYGQLQFRRRRRR